MNRSSINTKRPRKYNQKSLTTKNICNAGWYFPYLATYLVQSRHSSASYTTTCCRLHILLNDPDSSSIHISSLLIPFTNLALHPIRERIKCTLGGTCNACFLMASLARRISPIYRLIKLRRHAAFLLHPSGQVDFHSLQIENSIEELQVCFIVAL